MSILFGLKFECQAQIHPTQTFKGKQHIYLNSHWRILDEQGEFTQMEDSVITVKYKSITDSTTKSAIELSKGLTLIRKNSLGYIDYKVNGDSIFNIVNYLYNSTYVDFVKLNYYGKLLSVPCTPNDPYYISDGAHLDKIKAPDMWTYMYCGPNPVHNCHPIVAVIDNGMDVNHPDIGYGPDGYENIYKNSLEADWTNSADPTSGNALDDDNNGYTDDWKGWDFTGNNGVPIAIGDNDVKFENGGIPSNNVQQHGTKVSGIIAAKTNNGIGISGVAGGWANMPGAQILPINIDDGGFMLGSVVDDAIEYAVDNGAKIINMSFKVPFDQDIEDELAIAHANGVILIASSGNLEGLNNLNIVYPAKSKYCISVGASHYLNDWWEGYSCYIDGRLDLVAPRAQYSTTDPSIYADPTNGTSFSAPMVSGTAANMLCMNPCLTTEWSRDILRATADKASPTIHNYNPPGTFPEGYNEKMGYGRLNAYEAVKKSKEVYSSTLDLYIKDCIYDLGLTGADYACTTVTDESPDIWVRNQSDGFIYHDHEVPQSNISNQVYVYVRVHNKSCVASNGTEILNVYFSKAATWNSWPQNWDGTIPTLGNIISTVTLPVIEPGQEKIIEIPWTIPSVLFTTGITPFCILARVTNVSGDPIINSSNSLVEINNNVSIRNTMALSIGNSIIGNTKEDGHFYPLGDYIDIVNASVNAESFDFHFTVPSLNNGNIISDVSEITVIFDDSSWYAFQNAVELEQEGVQIVQDKEIKITKNNVVIRGVTLPANSRFTTFVGFNFLVDSFTTQRNFRYLVAQTYADSTSYLGGENIDIKQDPRIPFNADAGPDKSAFPGESVTITAAEVNEPVIYQWYLGSTLKHTGRVYTTTVDSMSMFTLKVTSTTDASIDYDDVKVNMKSGKINTIYPNPVTSSTTVEYTANHVNSATLMLIHPIYLTVGAYPLNTSNTSINLDLSALSIGTYSFILICDGNVQDSKSIQKQ